MTTISLVTEGAKDHLILSDNGRLALTSFTHSFLLSPEGTVEFFPRGYSMHFSLIYSTFSLIIILFSIATGAGERDDRSVKYLFASLMNLTSCF